jgi:hypothetical protein
MKTWKTMVRELNRARGLEFSKPDATNVGQDESMVICSQAASLAIKQRVLVQVETACLSRISYPSFNFSEFVRRDLPAFAFADSINGRFRFES